MSTGERALTCPKCPVGMNVQILAAGRRQCRTCGTERSASEASGGDSVPLSRQAERLGNLPPRGSATPPTGALTGHARWATPTIFLTCSGGCGLVEGPFIAAVSFFCSGCADGLVTANEGSKPAITGGSTPATIKPPTHSDPSRP